MPETKQQRSPRYGTPTMVLLHLVPGQYYERLAVRNIRGAVLHKTPFIAGKKSVYGRWEYDFDHTLPNQHYTPTGAEPMRYVVYSYGTHFPMYIYDKTTGQWYGNSDKYSPTTTRHQSAACPLDIRHTIIWLDTNKMIAVARYGVFATACHAAGGNAFDTTTD